MARFEIVRKIIHIFWGAAIGSAVWNGWVTAPVIFFTFLILIPAEYAVWHLRNPIARFLRKAEEGGLSPHRNGPQSREGGIIDEYGARRITILGFTVSCLFTFLLFPREIAAFSIFLLAFGDPASFFAGTILKKIPHPLDSEKHLTGSAAGVAVGALVAYFLHLPLVPALIASAAAFFFDAFNKVKIWRIRLDDDFIIPLAAGVVLGVVSKYLL